MMNEKTQELVNKVKDLFRQYYKEQIDADFLRLEINKEIDNIESEISDAMQERKEHE